MPLTKARVSAAARGLASTCELRKRKPNISCHVQRAQETAVLLRRSNDGMGGGDVLKSNIIFNMVRETQDQ